ncbi:proteasome assembly chaperone family protein [Glutamicibacter mishrai]|uniref:PAC2 family protein n=1 Tax=Glutamicibacter mishrai TaxID=1775880 RepID=A0A6H0SR96_9MICC|nr:PAC2 family protein [Glutamicibacter mishrai]QIV88497.1 PAC2 family protein [Glutamicibacter mishrai]
MNKDFHTPTLNTYIAESHHEIRPTIVVAAFEGWNDAGSAATDAVRLLLEENTYEHIATIGEDDFYDYQFSRPKTRRTAQGRMVDWPRTEIYKMALPHSAADLLVVLGVEPTFKWQSFCAQIIDVAQEHNAQAVLTLGALLADVPHTRPVPTSLSSDDPRLQEHFKIEASNYEGPSGIPTILGIEFERREIASMSLWAQLSHYVAQSPSPRVQLAFIEMLEELLPITVSDQQLRDDALAWKHGVDELAAADPDVAKYVKQLEEATDTSDLPEASGESIAREFERYLRRRGKFRPDGSGADFEI